MNFSWLQASLLERLTIQILVPILYFLCTLTYQHCFQACGHGVNPCRRPASSSSVMPGSCSEDAPATFASWRLHKQLTRCHWVEATYELVQVNGQAFMLRLTAIAACTRLSNMRKCHTACEVQCLNCVGSWTKTFVILISQARFHSSKRFASRKIPCTSNLDDRSAKMKGTMHELLSSADR